MAAADGLTPPYLLPLVALGLLVAVVVVALLLPRLVRLRRDELRVLAWLQVAAAGAWLASNKPDEGGVLFVVLPGHGLTVADLVALVPLGCAVWLPTRSARPRSAGTTA